MSALFSPGQFKNIKISICIFTVKYNTSVTMCWVQCSEYLIQWNIVNRRPVNLKDPISNMNGVFHIWTDAVRVHPE